MTGKSFHDDDEAVSPVIGVILMVAITVILAAVIGTFVLNLGGSVQENVQAGVSIEHNGGQNSVKATWTSNQNADNIDVNMTSSPDDYTYDDKLTEVGQSTTAQCDGTGTDFGGNDVTGDTIDITVTGNSGDTSTVLTTDSIDEC